MAKYRIRSLESEKGLDAEYLSKDKYAIEKIEARKDKDVRASSASFGILQHLEGRRKQVGALRRQAERLASQTAYHVKRDLQSGDTYPLYPGVPPMGQRDVRQMRKAKPGIVPRPEGFN